MTANGGGLGRVAAYTRTAATSQPPDEERLLRAHAPLVRRIAHHLSARLPQTVELEDLIQAGMIGLLEAARKFDPSQGASFETFAGIRIRGAMIDQVRPCDWTPRSVHRRSREMSEAVRRIENREGRSARDAEIMAELGYDEETYHRTLRDVNASRMLSLDDLFPLEDETFSGVAPASERPDRILPREAFSRALAEAITKLSEREQQVLSLYYDEELNLREIGEVLGVTESRVCQIHAKCVLRLRAQLADWVSGAGAREEVLGRGDEERDA